MALFKSSSLRSLVRPQIKTTQQQVSRPVITPQTRIPSITPKPMPRQSVVAKKTPVQQASVVPISAPMQPAVLAPVNNQDLLNRLREMQNQITNPTNPLYNSNYGNPQTYQPAQAPTRVNFESYGFDKGLVDYLNNQREISSFDAGISYNYDPVTQTFTGGAMGGPVTKTLAQIQAEAQNYANRPVYNPRNLSVSNFSGGGQLGVAQNEVNRPILEPYNPSDRRYASQLGVAQNPPTQMQVFSGMDYSQPTMRETNVNGNVISGFGQPLVPYTPNLPNYQNTQPFNGIQQMQGQLGMQPQQDFGAMSNMNTQNLGGMGQSPYNPMMGNNMAQPFNQTMPQTGFIPVG